MLKLELRDFFYRIDGFELVQAPKAAGFTLVVATEALHRLMQVQVEPEELQNLTMQAIGRIARADKLPVKKLGRCRISLFLGTACPTVFSTDPVFGASIGADPDHLARLAEKGLDAVDAIGPTMDFTAHNCDLSGQAVALLILAQTWAEWAYGKLLLQDMQAGRN
jgi:hypothetical protein